MLLKTEQTTPDKKRRFYRGHNNHRMQHENRKFVGPAGLRKPLRINIFLSILMLKKFP
ncbi:hypothetical protein BC792_10779 [Sphingobacterium allocomposti]|uniref:Uncharacterized protein n=1 Tax=Sphingobacterium allocomposti TaxID=415956 RepID=A0A5S5DJQ0_9SPHI|nr:hypothetical protein BC792_10779 [Sphingobacterium composti Yoo et al. 2007 non Ten et al. 2007]